MKHTTIEPLETRIAPAVIFALETGTNKLVSFDSAEPDTLLTDTVVSNIPQAGEFLVAIDFRPATGELYGLTIKDNGATRSGQLYKINTTTAAATAVGTAFSNTLADTSDYGFDFNPTVDRIRVINTLGQNFRLHPDSGILVLMDTAITPDIPAVAYDRNFGGTATTLYGYDFDKDNLIRIGGVDGNPSPNSGTVTIIAHAKINGGDILTNSQSIGFDIAAPYGGPDVGWLGAKIGGVFHLYNISLTTADLTDQGTIGDGTRNFGGLAVQTDAPAPTITGGKVATWTDVDGDLVTLKITVGTLTAANFRMLAGASGSVLSKLRLDSTNFNGTNITITAKPGPTGGDGIVNIGAIDAIPDLGAVSIPGDLVSISAGLNGAAASLKSLTIRSLGAFGTGPQPFTAGTTSTLADGAGKITILGDFAGSLQLGGGKTGNVTIGGDLIGGTADQSGQLYNLGATAFGKLLIKGNIRGGSGTNSGYVHLFKVAGVTILGSIYGGPLGAGKTQSGYMNLRGMGKGTVSVGGDLIGGIGQGQLSGTITVTDFAMVKIGGSLIGGEDLYGGRIALDNTAPGKILTLQIGGSLLGGNGNQSAAISTNGTIAINIKGDVIGSNGQSSAEIGLGYIGAQGTIKSLTIGGSVRSTGAPVNIQADRFGSIAIKGSVIGTTAAPVIISAGGKFSPANAAESVAIGKITIGGDLTFSRITAGLSASLFAITADAAIGTIKIGRDMIASNISTGTNPVNGIFGDNDDIFVGGNSGNPALIARIAGITIGGQLIGTAGGAVDRFGIIAEQIGSITVGKVKLDIIGNQGDFLTGFTDDVHIREL